MKEMILGFDLLILLVWKTVHLRFSRGVCVRYACICELLEMAKKYRSLVHICNKLFVCIEYLRYVRVNEKLFHCFFLYTLATMFLMYVFVCVKVLEENYSYDVVFVVCLYLYVINKVAGKT